MDWNQHLNQYCERTSEVFWSEPLNALSNAAFIIAALIVLKIWFTAQKNAKNTSSTQTNANDYSSLFLIGLLVVIGVGSFLFHTFATQWAMLADIIPIAIFMLAYFFLATRWYMRASYWLAWGSTLLFLGAMAFGPKLFSGLLGSTAGYAPALLAIFLFAILVRSTNHTTSKALWCASIIFTLSMGFRILDEPICSILPVGTHSLWHILNATVLFILIRAFIRFKTYLYGAAS
ncbi:ceramidase domain-containing protein [Pseudovibrio sp. Tun.PSC04-5.I4]|uniref:ceramidase domain-containing protein n=1 Tax=Pseudovibrio sp. Tun.PSC04-5.I4 TaxID=1798213 RepID=UPI00089037BB|nr:ceramidase domain-containing protein [Pseudovibrio sp. Tun.PSC04-5.I4]SDQ80945.1 Ceramidase [Pseudovibrio sp. Tun.PSC04-5.I4]